MKYYTLQACENLIQKYLDKGGEYIELGEGTLGLGKILCFGEGLKTAIITEYYTSAWSSGHKVNFYNKTPKKYQEIINNR